MRTRSTVPTDESTKIQPEPTKAQPKPVIRRLRVNEITKNKKKTLTKNVIQSIKNKYPLIDKLYDDHSSKPTKNSKPVTKRQLNKPEKSINLADYEEQDEKNTKKKPSNKNNKIIIDDSDNDSDNDSDSDDDDDSDDDYDSDSEMDFEVPKHIAKKLSKNKKEYNAFISKVSNIKTEYDINQVNIYDVINEGFNKQDSIWFYENLKRVQELEGKEKFDLEDKMKKKFSFIKTLKHHGLYENLYKSADRDIMKEIINSHHNKDVKTMLINRMQNASEESSEEYMKALNWMDVILSVPTSTKRKNEPISTILNNLHQKLSNNLYGMDDTINQILQAVCAILTDSNNKGYILTLVGPPGVGKTTISTLIAETVGMGYGQISCGSIKDQSVIMGHSSTYIGAKPGIITQILVKSKQLDNVITLDELDKLVDNSIIPVFLHVLDKSQNNKFNDAFCPEIDIDLSSNMWIITVNDVDKFDPALKDRLKIINVDGYDINQKVEIAVNHTIRKIMEKTGIHVPIEKSIIKKYIQLISPNQSGVRDIERFFEDIYEKLLLIKNIEHIKQRFGFPNNFNVNKLTCIDCKIIDKLTLTQ